MRRGELTLRTLELLVELAAIPLEATVVTLGLSGRPTIGRALFILDKLDGERTSRRAYFRDLRQTNDLIYRLKKAGLIHKKSGVIPLLTSEGKLLLKELQDNIYKNYLPTVDKYELEIDDELKIIIFDIPEKLKYKRDWFRMVLKNLDFKMVQKSVWKGKSKLPQELITDLKQFGLLSYIHIFSVKEKGTIV